MRRRLSIAIVAVCVSSAMGTAAMPQSVWSGVYSDAQAADGAAVYKTHCASCHGEALGGGESIPALRGVTFGAAWDGLPLSDLLDRMRKTMPPGKTGTVTRQDYAAVLAFLLKMNGMPPGGSALAAETSSLARVTFQTHKP